MRWSNDPCFLRSSDSHFKDYSVGVHVIFGNVFDDVSQLLLLVFDGAIA